MTPDLPGFAEPVAAAQACFRAVLDAMSRPGHVMRAGAGLTAPGPLESSTAAVLLTLCDAETPLWLDPAAASARDWVTFHCGSPIVGCEAASIAVGLRWSGLDGLSAGTDEAPETGATLILQVAGFGRGVGFRLAGPGLRASAVIQVDGLPAEFVAAWAANHALFPRGVDLILCAGDTLAALPRTTSVELA